MSRVRHNTPGLALRMQSLRAAAHRPGAISADQGRECAGHPIGERLGIAAVYAGRGEVDTARASALLIAAGIDDTPAHRAAVLRGIASIQRAVEAAVAVSH